LSSRVRSSGNKQSSRITHPITRSYHSRYNSKSNSNSTHIKRAANRRGSVATVFQWIDGDGDGDNDDDDDDDDGRGYATTLGNNHGQAHEREQRISNRPRGLSCPGSPALLRPLSSYRDHSSHFHVPKSRSRCPSPLGERRNVRISASPDVDSVAAAADAGKPDDAFSQAL